jgi:hypothetical protein
MPAPGAGPAGAADSHPPARERPLGSRPARPAPPGATTTNVPDHASVSAHARLREAGPARTAGRDDVTRRAHRSGRRDRTDQRRADGHPEDARYITGAQQRGIDPLHTHHHPSTNNQKHNTAVRTQRLPDTCAAFPPLIGPTVAPVFPAFWLHVWSPARGTITAPRGLLNVQRSWSLIFTGRAYWAPSRRRPQLTCCVPTKRSPNGHIWPTYPASASCPWRTARRRKGRQGPESGPLLGRKGPRVDAVPACGPCRTEARRQRLGRSRLPPCSCVSRPKRAAARAGAPSRRGSCRRGWTAGLGA